MKKFFFKSYGYFDVSNFKKIIEENNFDWDEFDFRQKKFKVHKETKTIPIIFDEEFSINKYTQTKYYPLFEKEILLLQEYLNNKLEQDGKIFRAILVNLPAKSEIKKHIDKGKSLSLPRRIHIAINTNEECFFTVGNIAKNLKEGEIWEINNDGRRHGVANDGDTDRIHLIADWIQNINDN
jgi:hypothetical protein